MERSSARRRPGRPQREIGGIQQRPWQQLTRPYAPIEILSARPEWLELLVPCTREAVDRIHSFLQQLEADLPADVRESVSMAFRELLMNGIEWGGGLNPEQKVRVACLRAKRMLL